MHMVTMRPNYHQPHCPPLGHSGPLKAQQGLGVGLQDGHLYSRINFKLNRTTALAEWRQLLSA